jgi:hypothetical protein
MSSRSRAATNLAWHLAGKTGIPVRVGWDNPSGRPGHGHWRVEWTDGPTVATMRGHAEDLVRYCRPLTTTMLRFSRFTTRQAWAAAMLALAYRGKLPERPAIAVGAAENELSDADIADWDHLWARAGQLIEHADHDIYQLAALIHATVTEPRNETPLRTTPGQCRHCATPLALTGTGRPSRYCNPACRQAAHRIHHNVTKPRNETNCAACGRTIIPRRAGRPARHCSPACRTRAWRRATGQPR